jgi:hypothetical protein
MLTEDQLTALVDALPVSARLILVLSCGSTSPKPPREPSSARVDATTAPDELVQGLGIRLVRGGAAHHSRPLAPGSFVSLGRVGRAPNDGGERALPIWLLSIVVGALEVVLSNVNGEREPAAFPRMRSPKLTAKKKLMLAARCDLLS